MLKLYAYTKGGAIFDAEVVWTTIGGGKVGFVSKEIVIKDGLVFYARPNGLTVTPLGKWSPCGTYFFADNYNDAALELTYESAKVIANANGGTKW